MNFLALPAKFRAKVKTTSECWLWIGAVSGGYGRFAWEGRVVQAHRLAYEILVGPIAPGLVTDHLCRNQICVNPSHLEPVPQRLNILRGQAPCAIAAARDKCVNGHSYDEINTYFTVVGDRVCRTCHREQAAAGRRAKGIRAVGTGRGKQVCLNGHPFSKENTHIAANGSRHCKECQRVASRQSYEKKRVVQ